MIVCKCSKWKEWIQRRCPLLRHCHNHLWTTFEPTKSIRYMFQLIGQFKTLFKVFRQFLIQLAMLQNSFGLFTLRNKGCKCVCVCVCARARVHVCACVSVHVHAWFILTTLREYPCVFTKHSSLTHGWESFYISFLSHFEASILAEYTNYIRICLSLLRDKAWDIFKLNVIIRGCL